MYSLSVKTSLLLLYSFFVCCTLSAQTAPSAEMTVQNSLSDTSVTHEMPQVTILAVRNGLLTKTPGSAAYIDSKELKLLLPISGNEVFRRVPGVHVTDEEGAGLRANIGIRGLDPDRSSSVLILEDGVPVTLAPYGEPQMYYTPAADRMAGVEVLKGSGQILFGPQTIGGVINYISLNPPSKGEANVRLNGGEGGYFNGLASYGNTVGKTGFIVTYLRKQADNIGPTMFRINDLTGKVKFEFTEKSSVGIKLGVYNEISNSTYVGITQDMFNRAEEDFVQISPFDRLDVSRYSASVTHDLEITPRIQLKTTAFAYRTTRNWQRQDFSYDKNVSNQTGVVWGDPLSENSAIYMRDQNGHRNRQFEVWGIEPRLNAAYTLGKLENELDAGVRYLYERAFEQRVNGTKKDAASGNLINDEIRTGRALSAFLQNRFLVSPAVSFNAGVRTEAYFFDRDITRTEEIDTSITANNSIFQVIPGIGANFNLGERITLFTGVHRGFAPPRIKDAISAAGEVYQLDAELSWNTEIGIRSKLGEAIEIEAAGFYTDFSNQIIPVSESSGGTGSGLVNGGSTRHIGAELGLRIDFARFFTPNRYSVICDFNGTFVDAVYNSDRFIGYNNEKINIKGNKTPYAPEFFFSTAFTLESPVGIGFRLTGTYIGEQFTDELNTVLPSENGRTGKLPSYFVLDGSVQYRIPKINATVNLSAKNLSDQRYITTRRPQGIRVGIPRFITAGIDIKI